MAGGAVRRRGQVGHHRVEQRLDALVGQGRAAQHRVEAAGDRGRAQARPQLRPIEVAALQVGRHQGVVGQGHALQQLMAVARRLVPQLRRDGAVDRRQAVRVPIVVAHGAHGHQVDHAPEVVLKPDRDLDRYRVGGEPVAQHVQAARERSAGAIHLVGEDDARHVVAVGLAPHRLRLRLHAGHAVEHHHAAVEHAQAAFHLDSKVDVPGRVDDSDAVVVPQARGGGGGDGDALAALLLGVVHGGRPVVDLAGAMDDAGDEQDALGDGGLAGVDVRDDPDVAGAVERIGSGHG